ncbi:hypothetical protein N478_22075 [Pseudoalteromonas luteoviolacea S4060-1]|uniref:Uncharacterized protein n=1 Tax=Pseudoalteromonas luteoviolacea S4060-1 TaxID=1365257 RepID=A0A161YQI8_9GAMM|nr:hypothetical protein N478_22075 [Pseudoalteromonas luteoviolacea S4060-1]
MLFSKKYYLPRCFIERCVVLAEKHLQMTSINQDRVLEAGRVQIDKDKLSMGLNSINRYKILRDNITASE